MSNLDEQLLDDCTNLASEMVRVSDSIRYINLDVNILTTEEVINLEELNCYAHDFLDNVLPYYHLHGGHLPVDEWQQLRGRMSHAQAALASLYKAYGHVLVSQQRDAS